MTNLITSKESREFWNVMRKKSDAKNDYALEKSSDGAIIAPDDFKADFIKALDKENLFRRRGTVISSSHADGTILTTLSTAVADWVNENTAYPQTNDTFGTIRIESHKLAALTKIKNTFVSDNKFCIGKYLCNDFARCIGRTEEKACIVGNGITQPTGILTGEAAVFTESPETISYDDIISLFFSLKAEYRKNAVFIVNDSTAMVLRKLKDNSGRYLWNEQSNTIFDRPVLTSQFMPEISGGNKCVAFGDISYYWIVERQPLAIKVLQECFAAEDMTGYIASERVDGSLINKEAVKLLQVSAPEVTDKEGN